MRWSVVPMALLIFLGSISVAWAQVQSHPLSQISPIDSNLNMYAYNNSVGYLNYSYGILNNGTQGILTADIASSAVTGSRIASNAITSSKLSNPLGGSVNASAYYDSDNSNYFADLAGIVTSITTAGKVGINTTSPSVKLDIHNGGDSDAIQIHGSNDTQYMFLSQNFNGGNSYARLGCWTGTSACNTVMDLGNVGIGTTSPNATLDVNGISLFRSGSQAGGAGLAYQMRFGYAGTDTYQHYIRTRHAGGQAESNAFDFYTSDGTQYGTFPTNAVLGLTVDNGKVGIGTTNPSAKLQVSSDSSDSFWVKSPTYGSRITMGPLNGKMQIFAYNDTSASSDDLILQGTYGRNVGIGTAGPAAKLDVVTGGGGHLYTSDYGCGAYGGIGGNSTLTACANYALLTAGADTFINRPSGSAIRFREGNGEQVIIASGGNVGIGTVNPASLLSISDSTSDPSNYGKTLQITRAGTAGQQAAFIRQGNRIVSLGYLPNSNVFGFGAAQTTDSLFTPTYLAIDSSGNVGINSTNPGSKMTVSGGDVFVATQGNGVIIHDSDGAGCHKITVNTAGTISAASVTCPSS